LVAPSAHASTIRARNANACALVRRRAQRCSVCRSCSVSTNGAFGLPRSAMHAGYQLLNELTTQNTRACLNTHRANLGNFQGGKGHDSGHAIDAWSGGYLCCGTLADTVTI
jgi:hypothetical protein